MNCRGHAYDVYIGRGGPWGNPFRIGVHGDRAEVIEKFRAHLLYRLSTESALAVKLQQLRGKVLGCWCKPETCHGDVLVEVLESGFGEALAVRTFFTGSGPIEAAVEHARLLAEGYSDAEARAMVYEEAP